MNSPLVGAWELVSDTRQGALVCSETHVSVMMADKNLRHIEEPTSDQIIEAYRGVNATAGTYTLSGPKLTVHRIANLKLHNIGQDHEAEIKIEGDQLTWRRTNSGVEDVWGKVS